LKPLRIGCVKYLNARPLIRGWAGDVDFDHPSALCRKLAGGELDIALASSFEFLRNPGYRVVDDVSIASAGPVYSVVVAHTGDISEIDEVELDPASETSVNLLRCLLAELRQRPRLIQNMDLQSVRPAPKAFEAESNTPEQSAVGRKGSPRRVRPVADNIPVFGAHRARLLIGDQAIGFRQRHAGEFHFWDLGEQWNKLVGLPFVYALWLIRPEVRDSTSIAERLRKLRDENRADIDELVAEEKEFDHDFCRRYYRDNLRFNFGKEEKQGLTEFHKRCVNLQLLPCDDLRLGAWDLELARRCV
jgi:chorismate dehydratase